KSPPFVPLFPILPFPLLPTAASARIVCHVLLSSRPWKLPARGTLSCDGGARCGLTRFTPSVHRPHRPQPYRGVWSGESGVKAVAGCRVLLPFPAFSLPNTTTLCLTTEPSIPLS
ncbi:hypothetical protein M427DRAFT_159058, partial [Gonapodya prolifera JEL478]